MNIENDLNIPPDEEPVTKKISRLATQFFLPVLLPASSAVVGWLAQRKSSASIEQLQRNNDHVKNLTDKVHNLSEELKQLERRRESLSGDLKKVHEKIDEEERAKFDSVSGDLEKIGEMLRDRQHMYCSWVTNHRHREEFEKKKLQPFSYSRPYDKEIGLYSGVLDILENDKHCGLDRGTNGHLMWVYMDLWKARAELQMCKNVVKKMTDI